MLHVSWKHTFLFGLPLLFNCILALSGEAAVMTQTNSVTSTGHIVIAPFDDSLGIMTNATVRVDWGVDPPGFTASASGNPGAQHAYSVNIGPFSLSGTTLQNSGSGFHNHQVRGGTSETFSGASLSLLDTGADYALPGGATSSAAGHVHATNAPTWPVRTTTSIDYIPFADLASVTITRSGFGTVMLPEFDTSLGTLLQADVDVQVSAQTTTGPGFASHVHTVGSFHTGPFSFQGSLSNARRNGSNSHFHTYLASDDGNIFRDANLSLFAAGGSTFGLPSSQVTSFDSSHRHYVQNFRSTTSTTFWYQPALSVESVPEPSSCLAFAGLAVLFGSAGLRRRRR